MTTVDYTPTVYGTGIKARIQRFGGYLAGMVMPAADSCTASAARWSAPSRPWAWSSAPTYRCSPSVR